MGYFATGVTVVTSKIDGRPCAMTANSVSSLSLDPPLVMFCPDNESETKRGVEQSGFFAINILAEGGERISRDFSARGPKTWDGIGFRTEVTGAPVFEDALAWLDCTVFAQYPGGDHVIVVGEAVKVDAAPHGNPLLFYRGGYHTLGS